MDSKLPSSGECVPIGTPVGGVHNYIQKMMEFNRKLNRNRVKSRIPVFSQGVKLTRSQSVRENAAPSKTHHFSITKLVEASAATKSEKEETKLQLENEPLSESDSLKKLETPVPVTTNVEAGNVPLPVQLSGLPGIRAGTLVRSASFKEKFPSFSSNPATFASRFAALKATLSEKQSPEEPYNAEETIRKYLETFPTVLLQGNAEETIRKYLETFPTVLLQGNAGSTYIPKWNWLNALKTAVNAPRSSAIWDLHQKAFKASTILGQIRNDFEFGLNKDEALVTKVCEDMKIPHVGPQIRRNMVAPDMIPYLRNIFDTEMKKQDKYIAITSSLPLTDEKDMKKRNLVVQWLIRTAKDIGCCADTVHLAVYIVDAYCTGQTMKTCPWQLLAITALHIASKFEEINVYYLPKLIKMAKQMFTVQDVSRIERKILEKLRFDLCPPTAPFLASLVIFGGSLKFPTVSLRKLTLDLTLGILYKSLDNYKLSLIPPADKAKAALEIAVEMLFFQYNYFSNRDMSAHKPSLVPGLAVGDFALDMCTEVFLQQCTRKDILPSQVQADSCNSSPVRGV